jgi:hypothetical protein
MRAFLNLRYTVPERRRVYSDGLKRLGYEIKDGAPLNPLRGDILITWNRSGIGDKAAAVFEANGLPVLVTENAAWGNSFAGDRWYTLARNRHNTAGRFPIGENNRWDDLNIEFPEWRTKGETVILAQRGIGAPPTSSPLRWADKINESKGWRIRRHPGTKPAIPLDDDLAQCGRVITWGSGAAIKALLMGIPVTSYMPKWVGEQDNTDAGRLAMFRRLAWAQFRLSEFESGYAFARMLT